MENFKFLHEKKCIKSFQVIDFFTTQKGRYFKIEIIFQNESILYATEYAGENERNYAFHWQDKEKNLIIRWDNAPHHKNIKTFPHHIHINNEILESKDFSLSQIIDYIEKQIQ